MHNWNFAAACLLLVLAHWSGNASAEHGQPSLHPGQLLITGSSTMAPLVVAIANRFESLNQGVRIEVQTGGSGRGISDVREGKSDIGMVARTLVEKDRDLYGVPIARDGVTLILHRGNPVQTLNDREIIDIFTGKITNWKQVGGSDAPILVLASEPERGSSELFIRYLGIEYRDIRPQRLVGDNALRIKTVADTPNAIVYISVGEAERNANAGAAIKLLPAGGVTATTRNVRKGDFPISRPLTLVTRELPQGLAKRFIEFSLSSQITDIIVAHDFVPYLD